MGHIELNLLLHTHVSAILGGHVLVRFFDQHFDDRQWCIYSVNLQQLLETKHFEP